MSKQARVRPSWGKKTRRKTRHQIKQAAREFQRRARESVGKLDTQKPGRPAIDWF